MEGVYDTMKKLKYVVNMMLTNYSYKQLAYLLGCYVVTADKEINEHELRSCLNLIKN